MTKVLVGNLHTMTSGPGEKVLIDQIQDGEDGADSTVPGPVGPAGDPGLDASQDPGLYNDREQTMSRFDVTVGQATTSGSIYLSFFTARENRTITKLRMFNGAFAVGTTLARMGLYKQASDGDLDILGSTENDTGLFGSLNTIFTKDLTNPVEIIKGDRYALGFVVVSTGTAGSRSGFNFSNTNVGAFEPRSNAIVPGQSDLLNHIFQSQLNPTTLMHYWEALP